MERERSFLAKSHRGAKGEGEDGVAWRIHEADLRVNPISSDGLGTLQSTMPSYLSPHEEAVGCGGSSPNPIHQAGPLIRSAAVLFFARWARSPFCALGRSSLTKPVTLKAEKRRQVGREDLQKIRSVANKQTNKKILFF